MPDGANPCPDPDQQHRAENVRRWPMAEDRHGIRSRRRKLHLAVKAGNGDVIADTLAEQNTEDPAQVEPLLNQLDGEIGQFTADCAL